MVPATDAVKTASWPRACLATGLLLSSLTTMAESATGPWPASRGKDGGTPRPRGFPERIALCSQWLDPSWNAGGALPWDMQRRTDLATSEQRGTIHVVYYWQLFRALVGKSETGKGGSSSTHGDRFIDALRDNPKGLRSYLERFRRDLSACRNALVPVLFILEGDQMNVARHHCITRLGGDANRLPVAVKASGHPDALAAGTPDSWAGFLQVLAYLRDTYAPNVMLSPVQKLHAGPIVRSKGQNADDRLTERHLAEVKMNVAFWRSAGVKWDALSVNWGPGGGMAFPDEASFRRAVRFHGAVARGLGLWAINWRVRVLAEDLRARTPLAAWKNNVPHLILTSLAFMESQGFTAVCWEFDKKEKEPADLGPFGEAVHDYYEKAGSFH